MTARRGRRRSADVTTPTSTPSPSRHRLLETSADLFWTRGYRATTTRQIAAVLGLQQASLYHHVSSKDDLLVEICRLALGELLAATDASLANAADPRARLDDLVRTGIRTQLGNQKAHATMAFEMRAVSPARRADLATLCERYRADVDGVIADAQRAGLVRADVDAHLIALSLWNLMSWTLLWYRKDGDIGPEAMAASLHDLWCRGVATSRRTGAAVVVPGAPAAAGHGRESGSARTADRVLDAAASLFRTRGYDGTSAREIAAGLGIQKASLYHHTPGKNRLLYEVCAQSQGQMRQGVQAAVEAASTPIDRVRAMAAAHVATLLRHQDRHATSLLELRALSGSDRRTIVALREEYDAFVRSIIDDAQRAGDVRSDLPASVLALFLFSLVNRSMLWYRPDGPLSPEQLGGLFASCYLGGVTTVDAGA